MSFKFTTDKFWSIWKLNFDVNCRVLKNICLLGFHRIRILQKKGHQINDCEICTLFVVNILRVSIDMNLKLSIYLHIIFFFGFCCKLGHSLYLNFDKEKKIGRKIHFLRLRCSAWIYSNRMILTTSNQVSALSFLPIDWGYRVRLFAMFVFLLVHVF